MVIASLLHFRIQTHNAYSQRGDIAALPSLGVRFTIALYKSQPLPAALLSLDEDPYVRVSTVPTCSAHVINQPRSIPKTTQKKFI
jgi:hypothetical protein